MAVWNKLGSGNWNDPTAWDVNAVPNASGAVADLTLLVPAIVTHAVDLQGLSFTVGTLNMMSSAIENYRLNNGTIRMQAISGSASIGAAVSGGGVANSSQMAANTTLNLVSNTSVDTTGTGAVLDVFSKVIGSGILAKSGTGTLRLGGTASTYSGGTKINAGTVETLASAGLGTGAITFSGTSTLRAAQTLTVANAITIASGSSGTIGATNLSKLTLTGTFNYYGGPGTILHFGSVSSTGIVAFAASGPGNVAITSGGSISIDGGTLQTVGNLGFLTAHDAGNNIAFGAVLDINGNSQFVNNLSGAGTLTSNVAGVAIVTVDEISASSFSGVVSDGAGTLGLTKIGAADFVLGGINTYTGNTIVSAGTLTLNATASIAASSFVAIAAGARLNLNGSAQFLTNLANNGLVSMAGYGLVLNNQSNDLTGNFLGVGASQSDFVKVILSQATQSMSLAGATFNNWFSNNNVFVVGNNQGNTITGSAQADTVTCGSGNDSVMGGAGDDTMAAWGQIRRCFPLRFPPLPSPIMPMVR